MAEEPVLVVDDDPSAGDYLAQALAAEFPNVQTASDGVHALLSMERQLPALVITDLRMPVMDGMELLEHVKERWPEVPVILVTVEKDLATVIEAVRRGAINYLVKPVSPGSIRSAATQALATARLADTDGDRWDSGIVGESPAAVQIRHQVALAARSDVNVLVTGETGTGKELVARAIHRSSSHHDAPFVAHNCALTPPDLFESQYFGHLRGAFTSAEGNRIGLLTEADGGILFLDELECLSPAQQAKLLRVLDDGEVRAVGSDRATTVSVRFLAATNREPPTLLANGSLREDFYYRLRGFEIHLPPLRERMQDIPLLASYFLETTEAKLTPEALESLVAHSWPGNVRELRNVLRGAAARAPRGRITSSQLVLGSPPARDASQEPASVSSLRELEREAIHQALERFGGNQSRTAHALGIDRSTLRRKIQEYGA